MKLDVLIIAAHPDDAEISLGGTILRLVQNGRKVGVLDVTRGEMGTRGDRTSRAQEAERTVPPGVSRERKVVEGRKDLITERRRYDRSASVVLARVVQDAVLAVERVPSGV